MFCFERDCPFPLKSCLSSEKVLKCRESKKPRLFMENCKCQNGYEDSPDKPENSQC